jgi:hypothetical protein
MMAPLSARQEKARDLADSLGRMAGVWVVSPLPLDDGARALRFQVLDRERDKVVIKLCKKGIIPNLVQGHPRFTPNGLIPASLFEVEIERERQSVPTDGPKISGELAKQEKTPAEVAAVRRYLGWK